VTLDYLTEIYSSFEPFQSPQKDAQKDVYVDCKGVRGDWDVFRELGRKITRSKQPTCQLYSGHRGVGKSTELLRLKEYLQDLHRYSVYSVDGALRWRFSEAMPKAIHTLLMETLRKSWE